MGKYKRPAQDLGRWPIRRGDEVVVITGEDRGRRGKVLRVDRKRNRVVVEGVNRVKRHQRPSQKNPQGGIVEKEMPVHLSNVMIWDATEQKPAKVGRRQLDDGTWVRFSRASGETLEQ